MSPAAALGSGVVLAYVKLSAALLGGTGLLLLVLTHGLHRRLDAVWRTYRGWLVMVPLVLAVVVAGRAATIIGIALLALAGFKEFARATGLYRDWWMTGAVYVGILALAASALVEDPWLHRPGWYGLFMALPVFTISLILAVPIVRNRAKGQLQSLALAILGFIYVGWMFSHIGFLANSPHAYGYLLFLILAVEGSDVAAFTTGKLFGRRKLREAISPNKTWGGAAGALTVSMLLPWALRFSIPHFGPLQLVLTGLIVGVGGQLGDLTMSAIKRDLGVKDMGGAIPGHGGVLDRIDSLIFAGPLFFHMVRWYYGVY
ncbi:MAG TPA: phosphatidate cytidylyltransferase [Vicinamibacterales bacterium]|nr:phosphatidate cytidylyltransferase [Vicinamibacterales bacterium]